MRLLLIALLGGLALCACAKPDVETETAKCLLEADRTYAHAADAYVMATSYTHTCMSAKGYALLEASDRCQTSEAERTPACYRHR